MVWKAIAEAEAGSDTWGCPDLTPILRRSADIFAPNGASTYLADLTGMVALTTNPIPFLDTLRSLAWRRGLMEGMNQIRSRCLDGSCEDGSVASAIGELVARSDERQSMSVEPNGGFLEEYVNNLCSGVVARSQDGLS